MAVLALGIAGAAGAGALGLAPAWGWLAGTVLGSALFPQRLPAQHGPRLGDLTVTTSTYGVPIARGFGTVRIAGNMIWSSGIREVETRQNRRVGKGGQRQTTVAYSYVASFAIAFGRGPAEGVVQIFADGKLIFDVTRDGFLSKGITVRFHPGTDSQLPDPLIQAERGIENTPAHRDLVYVVFEDLPLADYGNRIPQISAVIAFKAQGLFPHVAYGETGWSYDQIWWMRR